MWEINPTAGGTGPTVGPNVTKCQCPYVGKNSTALSHCSSAPAPRASPCHHSNLDISAKSPKLWKPPLSAWELSISATTLWAAAPTRFPSAAAIPAHSTIQCPPLRHPTSPSAHPARAGVCSQSPYPAERTNKKTAGSHGTGSLDGHPPLLRQQVSSRAPPSLSASSSARLLARSHGQSPTGTSHRGPPTSLTPSRSS